jgi:hypothetical protein
MTKSKIGHTISQPVLTHGQGAGSREMMLIVFVKCDFNICCTD